jgi:hypothetical protein
MRSGMELLLFDIPLAQSKGRLSIKPSLAESHPLQTLLLLPSQPANSHLLALA